MNFESALNRKYIKWGLIWGVWTLFGFFFASQVALQSQLSKNPTPFWQILSWQLFSGYVWFAISPVILWLGRTFSFEERKWKISIPVHLVAGFVIAIAQLAIDAYVLPKLGYMRQYETAGYLEILKIFLLVNLHFGVAIYWGVIGVQQALKYYRKYRERELRTSQLEAR